MRDRLEGTLLLCDQVYEDRGKVSLLGAKWNRTSPGEKHLTAVAVLDFSAPDGAETFEVAFMLTTALEPETVIAQSAVEGELIPPSGSGSDPSWVPPHDQMLVPLRWNVTLEPETAYVLTMKHGDRVITSTSFATTARAEDGAGAG